MRISRVLLCLPVVSLLAAPPTRWVSRGPGGGGAFFAPAINPADPGELWVQSDMSDAFHSRDGGRSWDTLDFRSLQGGNQWSPAQFTSVPSVRYANSGGVPRRSLDGGATWATLSVAGGDSVYTLFADPQATNRLVVSTYGSLYFSANGGNTFASRYTASDLHVGGVFWDGNSIYVGTQAGLVVSTNQGASFALASYAGLPAGEAILSFCGARAGNLVRLFCLTWSAGDVYPGVQAYDGGQMAGVYRLDVAPGATWQRVTTGIGTHNPCFVGMARTDPAIAYLAGANPDGDAPSVLKTTNGGAAWSPVLLTTGNQNVRTGWQGDDTGPWNWRKWSFGGQALGFTVCATDPQRAMVTDFGYVHLTENGGQSWRNVTTDEADLNPAGSPTDKARAYRGSGLEDTSCWHLCFPSSNTVVAGFTDIRGMRSTDGGNAWTFPMSLPYNSTYWIVRHPDGKLYAAGSSVHDLYAWDTYCRDARIDAGTGAVLVSSDQGATWSTLYNFARPVVGLALDPNNPNVLLATVVHSGVGGVYRTTNLQNGTAATWTRLTVPPRTEGHPYVVQVLNDGSYLCSYSARITTDFTASSGVFLSTDGGATWADRTDAAMRYYTKDVVVDPHDPAQNTWYAGVWGEWGASANKGGLYRTTNRGVSWTRITSGLKAVGSCTVSPWNADEMFVTTEDQGLWVSSNRRAATPTFAATSYPFRFPSRVFYPPSQSNEVWVLSFGNGMRLGRMVEPAPRLLGLAPTPGRLSLRAAPGQRVVWSRSPDLTAWEDVGTLRVNQSDLPWTDPGAYAWPRAFYRVRVE
jgi:photosystem II stability/assembly factor-like uncharacterized protein